MSSQQPSSREPQSFMDKFGPQSGGQSSYQQPSYQQPMYQQPSYQQPSYQQPSYQQPMYQQPMYQQQYQVPGIPDDARTYRSASNMCFLLWILLLGAAVYLSANPDPKTLPLLTPVGVGAGLSWLAAWCFSMKSKGYSAFLGLLAIFGLIGAIVMIILPNKYKRR